MHLRAISLSAALVAPILFAAAWAAGASQAAAPAASTDGTSQNAELAREAQSLQAVCGKCHNLELVLNTPKSYDAWQDTVQKMVDRGARGTDDQYDDIMDYLHRTVTTIDVNSADADELQMVLGVSEATAQAIVERRKAKKFTGLADLKSIRGVSASYLDSRVRLIFFN